MRSAPAVQIVAGYAAGNRDRIASVAANEYAYIYIGAPEGAHVIIMPDPRLARDHYRLDTK